MILHVSPVERPKQPRLLQGLGIQDVAHGGPIRGSSLLPAEIQDMLPIDSNVPTWLSNFGRSEGVPNLTNIFKTPEKGDICPFPHLIRVSRRRNAVRWMRLLCMTLPNTDPFIRRVRNQRKQLQVAFESKTLGLLTCKQKEKTYATLEG